MRALARDASGVWSQRAKLSMDGRQAATTAWPLFISFRMESRTSAGTEPGSSSYTTEVSASLPRRRTDLTMMSRPGERSAP